MNPSVRSLLSLSAVKFSSAVAAALNAGFRKDAWQSRQICCLASISGAVRGFNEIAKRGKAPARTGEKTDQRCGRVAASRQLHLLARSNSAIVLILLACVLLPKWMEGQISLPSAGNIDTIAGNGSWGYSGDGGQATSAQLASPTETAVDAAGNVYFADYEYTTIRKVNAATGIISTVAGTGVPGFSGDGGPATSAQLAYVQGLAVDAAGNIYIADTGNGRIRAVSAATGVIRTVAGNGGYGFSGDGGLAIYATLYYPVGVAVDSAGNIYFSDENNNRIREVWAANQIITTVAGNGTQGYTGDGGLAVNAELNDPRHRC